MARLRSGLRILAATLLVSAAAGSAARAAETGPRVVASIKPVHSLVAGVMAGIGVPYLIVRGGASPHTYGLRPSDAHALETAQAVFWIGPDLEAFLVRPLAALVGGRAVPLGESPGLTRLPLRTGATFEPDEDDDDHGAAEAAGSATARGTHFDSHVWLDPLNGAAMVRTIARVLSGIDPEHAARYGENARAVTRELEALGGEIADALAPYKGRPFIVFHDAYQYLEHRAGLAAAGSITVSPETQPGAERLRQIKDRLRALGAVCIFTEPQFEPRIVRILAESSNVRTGVLDPLGADLAEGPELYARLMRRNVEAIQRCLAP